MTALRREILIGAGALGLLSACNQGGGGGGARSRFEEDGDMALGDPNAPIVLVEYASVMCTHCAHFHKEILPTLKAQYVDTGKVRYVLREFATPPREFAVAGFLIARCAGTTPQRYFQVVDALFQQQIAVFEAAQAGQGREKLLEIARSAGLSEDQFNQCVSDQNAIQRLQAVEKRGVEEFKITATPSFVMNGSKLDLKTGTLEEMQGFIDAELAKLGKK